MQNNRNQSQIVLWEGSPNYVSVYPIENDNSIVTIENAKILSYTGTKLNGNKIQYGPTESIAPFTSNNVSIQYEILPYKSQPTSVNKILTNIKAYKIETFLEGNILLIIILMAILVFICYLFFTRLLKKLRKPYVPAKKVV
uniref:Dolichyl-diphosphooligosaccharide--protein glycosyltransferase subunit 1 n=1 Tax=Panagrolaimus superbus TaxID=310955 RepID=A0A914XTN1_9BILA